MNRAIDADEYDEDRERNEEEVREDNREHARELERVSAEPDEE